MSTLPPPPSSRNSLPPSQRFQPSLPPPAPSYSSEQIARVSQLLDTLGAVVLLAWHTIRSAVRRPLEFRALIYQIDALGVQSMGIVAVTSVFIGMVMTIQFAFGLQRFGGVEYIPRVIVLSFVRELAPTLTAIIVGGRIGSGMAAEVGAMNVTEQVDAIRALGADPAKKLVLPRVGAALIAMPILSLIALLLGSLGAMFICDIQYAITPQYFLRSSLEVVQMSDLINGVAKTPFFGFIIAIVGCYFGLQTKGGTEGVGRSTTKTVVVVSIAILIADFLLTKIFIAMGSGA